MQRKRKRCVRWCIHVDESSLVRLKKKKKWVCCCSPGGSGWVNSRANEATKSQDKNMEEYYLTAFKKGKARVRLGSLEQ